MKYYVISIIFISFFVNLFSQETKTSYSKVYSSFDDRTERIILGTFGHESVNDTLLIFSISDNIMIIYLKNGIYKLKIFQENYNYDLHKEELIEIRNSDIMECKTLKNIFFRNVCKNNFIDLTKYASSDSYYIYFNIVINGVSKCELIQPITYSSSTKRRIKNRKLIDQKVFDYLYINLINNK